MPLKPNAIRERWNRIRGNSDCNLELTAASVSEYLSKPETELVRDRIAESLSQLAAFRLEKGKFRSDEPSAPGDLVTCEGLEAFLVPAVQGALRFTDFLKKFTTSDDRKEQFVAALCDDIKKLLDMWSRGDGHFPGEPYANQASILQGLPQPLVQGALRNGIDITEAAAMACRVLVHLITLKQNYSAGKESGEYVGQLIGRLDEKKIYTALGNSIRFLVTAFQKGEGATEEEKIVNAKIGREEGSGWSWTSAELAHLPPLLFFSSVAVDAFAELDLYLIRASINNADNGSGSEKLIEFYETERAVIEQFQLCVEMTRLWVLKSVLPNVSFKLGQHREPEIEYVPLDKSVLDLHQQSLERDGFKESPTLFYNNLYALQILLWSWADWGEKGESQDDEVRSKVNRALTQLIANDGKPSVREILSSVSYKFYLPGKGFFAAGGEKSWAYLDFGFLQLLTRLLILYVVYGVGDRNLLEPVIRDLYVRLMQNQNRTEIKYSALWAETKIEIFSTQRAIQALTFYWAYARGKEAGQTKTTHDPAPANEILLFQNKTGRRLVLQAFSELPEEKKETEQRSVGAKKPDIPAALAGANIFGDYCKAANFDVRPELAKDEGERDLIFKVTFLGTEIIKAVKAGKIDEYRAAILLLDSLGAIAQKPARDDGILDREFELIQQQFRNLSGQLGRGKSSGA